MRLSLFNSLTRKKEVFCPIDPNFIRFYVCGPTVYDRPHIGNARSVVVYDILYRILMHIYGANNVRYVSNITDVDDKIIAKAKELNIPISEVTEKTTEYFYHDMDFLGCLRPNISPKATEHILEMIKMIESLLAKKVAYEANGHVYFDVSKAPDYNQLSGRDFASMLEGVRIENSQDKKSAADFVLWKPADEGDEIGANFDSPFGNGRPGWHIECSAMSHKYLGEDFDIHGGGVDLIFPHHTNEIAQSICAFPGSKFAKMWVHNGFLTVNHEKMSKSLGNFITVYDLIEKGIDGDVIRLFLLSNHYRKPLDYNDKAIEDAHKTLSYWYRAVEELEFGMASSDDDISNEVMEALLDDMNITLAVKLINDYAKNAHLASKNGDAYAYKTNALKILSSARFIGLMRKSPKEWFQTFEKSCDIEKLIAKRNAAKAEKDWQKADQIRNELKNMGIIIEDKPGGIVTWRKE